MNRRTHHTKIFLIVLGLFIPGCILVNSPTTADPATTGSVTPVPSLAESSTSTSAPTTAPTASVYPPVFDPEALGDNRELASFSMTVTSKRTENGAVAVDQNDTFEYIREPFGMYWLGGSMYVIDDRLYERINGGRGWHYRVGPYQGDVLNWQAVKTPMALISGLQSAQFLGQEDYKGIPANHFTFDETNFHETVDPVPGEWGYKTDEAEGDLYLAQDGNYLLYYHVIDRGTLYEPTSTIGSATVQENTYELTMINQLVEIAVPADFDLEIDFGLPLPAGTILGEIISYRDGFSPDTYYYSLPVSYDEFLEFYKSLTPTNGFTFSRIGEVPNNIECDSQDCVILKKGNVEILLRHSSGTDSNFLSAQVYR